MTGIGKNHSAQEGRRIALKKVEKIGIKGQESFQCKTVPGGEISEETLHQDGFAGTAGIKIDFCG